MRVRGTKVSVPEYLGVFRSHLRAMEAANDASYLTYPDITPKPWVCLDTLRGQQRKVLS